MRLKNLTLLILVFALGLASCTKTQKGNDRNNARPLTKKNIQMVEGEEEAVLTQPPAVPPAITRKHASKVIVQMETQETEMSLNGDVQFQFWTFGGTVPGQFIRVREGDLVEFHLKNNPANKMPHNIDLHAVTGPGGGATSSVTAPGHESVFKFTALHSGLYMYYCATSPVGMHVSHGMYGLIMVDPKTPLPEVDKEFYVMQSEFYVDGDPTAPGVHKFEMEKALKGDPDYVVFNGSVGALTGDNAMQAKVGDRIRIYFGNAGPVAVSSAHIIGEIFDNVRPDGGKVTRNDASTVLVPVGGTAILEFVVETPGTYKLIDHSFFNAFNKGAIAELQVSGEENLLVYSGKEDDRIYLPEGSVVQSMPGGEGPQQVAAVSKEERISKGKLIYEQVCVACHQLNGQGIPGAFPPLAASDYLNNDPNAAISAVAHGLQGSITVNGNTYNGMMPKQNLSSEEIANVLTYVFNSWDNNGTVITPEMVDAIK